MEETAYRQFADLEEDHFWFRGRRRIFFDLLDRYLAGRRDLAVLEVGCGAGGFLRRLDRYGRPIGIELDPGIGRICRARGTAPVLQADAYAIPLPDASQDLVCLFDTLEHIPDEARALREVARVMRPGSLAFFSVPAYPFLYANNDRVARHCRRYTRGRLAAVLEAAGFERLKLSYFNTLLFPAILPAVLLGKLKERWLGLRDPEHTNLAVRLPRWLSELAFRAMAAERWPLAHLSLPFGHSLLAVVRKPAPPGDEPYWMRTRPAKPSS
jgi:SAM-dependent methyltransferase